MESESVEHEGFLGHELSRLLFHALLSRSTTLRLERDLGANDPQSYPGGYAQLAATPCVFCPVLPVTLTILCNT